MNNFQDVKLQTDLTHLRLSLSNGEKILKDYYIFCSLGLQFYWLSHHDLDEYSIMTDSGVFINSLYCMRTLWECPDCSRY